MKSRTEKVCAVILKRLNVGESDKLITAFSSTRGKISFRAKGVRRINSRRSPHLEIFNEVSLELYLAGTMPILSEAQSKQVFASLRSKMEIVSLSYYLIEVIDRLVPENESYPRFYDRFVETLVKLDHLARESDDQGMAQKMIKQCVAELLWTLGYLPWGKLPAQGLTSFVEEVVEHRVQSRRFLEDAAST